MNGWTFSRTELVLVSYFWKITKFFTWKSSTTDEQRRPDPGKRSGEGEKGEIHSKISQKVIYIYIIFPEVVRCHRRQIQATAAAAKEEERRMLHHRLKIETKFLLRRLFLYFYEKREMR